MSENFMIVNGKQFRVTNAWVEVESPSDGRMRWGIVTEAAEEQPATPADATARPADRKDQESGELEEPAQLFRQSGPAVFLPRSEER